MSGYSSYTSRPLPAVAGVGRMTDKAEVADIAALTERFCTNKVGIVQFAVVDDVGVTAHRAELHQSAPAENLRIDTFVALEVKHILRIVLVPCVAPAEARAFFEAEGYDLLHQRHEEGLF